MQKKLFRWSSPFFLFATIPLLVCSWNYKLSHFCLNWYSWKFWLQTGKEAKNVFIFKKKYIHESFGCKQARRQKCFHIPETPNFLFSSFHKNDSSKLCSDSAFVPTWIFKLHVALIKLDICFCHIDRYLFYGLPR